MLKLFKEEAFEKARKMKAAALSSRSKKSTLFSYRCTNKRSFLRISNYVIKRA
jgi:hypothetical protein